MRMPLFSYFTTIGTILSGLLIWLGNETGPDNSAPKTSQVIGVPKPFKAEPEPPAQVTATNFAAAYAPAKPRR